MGACLIRRAKTRIGDGESLRGTNEDSARQICLEVRRAIKRFDLLRNQRLVVLRISATKR
jgi:hypothetical protein